MNILIAQFKQETNTFIAGKTSLADFRARCLLYGEDIITCFKGNKNEMGAFIDVLSKRDDIIIIPAAAANSMPGPLVEYEVYDHIRTIIIEDIKKAGRLDGILLSLHGAMVVDGIEDPEGELLEEIRTAAGESVPICISLDFHANITDKMTKNADLMFPFRYYPHVDMYERGLKAAESLLDILDEKVTPVKCVRKQPVLCPLMTTDETPFSDFLTLLETMEKNEKVISASLSAGFPYADIYEGGMCVIVQTDGDISLAESLADQFSSFVYSLHSKLKFKAVSSKEAVLYAKNTVGITVLADAADNPGAGGPEDSTEILHELLQQNVQNAIFAAIYDPAAAKQAMEAGIGNTINISLGGKSDPRVGPPVTAEAYVKNITDGVYVNKDSMSCGVVNSLGLTAVLVISGVTIIVISKRHQPWDPEIFRANGIEPKDASVIVLKSSIHYRAAYSRFADNMITVNAKNIWSPDLLSLDIRNCRRPIYPLDIV